MSLFFIDVEAVGRAPRYGLMTEFGAVEYKTRQTFHGVIWRSSPDPANPAVPMYPGPEALVEPVTQVAARFKEWLLKFPAPHKMVSDNPAYDYQWINDAFAQAQLDNPLGHSARRIGDFAAGLEADFYARQDWKKLRVTPHDHNPVNDAMGNVEAFARLLDRAAVLRGQIKC